LENHIITDAISLSEEAGCPNGAGLGSPGGLGWEGPAVGGGGGGILGNGGKEENVNIVSFVIFHKLTLFCSNLNILEADDSNLLMTVPLCPSVSPLNCMIFVEQLQNLVVKHIVFQFA
jgi:hypothetical protein